MNQNETNAAEGASLSNAELGVVCEHGQLKRSCDLCDRDAEIERLRRALMDCDHQTDSMRVWGGMEWKYHPPQAGRIHNIVRAALDTVPNSQVSGASHDD